MNTMIPRENIPHGAIKDMLDYYGLVTFENYGKPVTEHCKTTELRYKDTIQENVECNSLDPVTFAKKTVIGTKWGGYRVRGVFT